ncbi:MAG: hypothetical protein J4G13_09740 [Dehalococcoidia bacterium]|nr:hypothetical protein [Dehalococcoidia bacterium]
MEVGVMVPGFGGLFFYPDQPDVLNVYLLDPEDAEQKAAVEDAINEVFPGAIPSGGIEVIEGKYSVVQLKAWYDDLRYALARSGLVGNGMILTDLHEGINGLEVVVEDERARAKVASIVEDAGIPPEVVRVTIGEPIREFSLRTRP